MGGIEEPLLKTMDQFTARFLINSKVFAEMPFNLSPGQSLLVGNTKGQGDLRIPADSVSRKHLYIARDGDGGLLVCDAGSSNGSFVSGTPLSQSQWHRLRSGEKIGLGREISLEIFEHRLGPAPPPIPHADPDQTLLEPVEATEPTLPKKRKSKRKRRDFDEEEDVLSGKDLEILDQIAAHESQAAQSKSLESLSETIGILLVVAIAICAALTNPSKQDHLQAISDRNELEGAIVGLANDFGAVNYKSFVVFSLLKIDGEVVTIGFFKNVIFNEGKPQKSHQGP